jgi:hypothetical protein
MTGFDLDKDILSHMPQLHSFNFNISSMVAPNAARRLKSNDIQRTFPIDQFHRIQANCSVAYATDGHGLGDIFSLPYKFESFHVFFYTIFPDIPFTNVRSLMLEDTEKNSYEHEFFIRISRLFPMLEQLSIAFSIPQTHKHRVVSPIEFSRLTILLFMNNTHIDYIEQFLMETNTRLPNLVELQIKYQHFATATNEFTDNRGRVNCAHITKLHVDVVFAGTNSFYVYFPSLRHLCETRCTSWN